MSVLWTLAVKDLRLFVRDRLALFWSLAFPLIFGLFFGAISGGGGRGNAAMPILVVDEADNEGSRAFVQRLEASEALQVERATDLQIARAKVRTGDKVAFVRITPEFADGAFAMFGRAPDDPAVVQVGVDPARAAEKGYLQGLINQSLFQGLSRTFSDPAALDQQLATARKSLATATDAEMPASQREALTTLFDALDGLPAATASGDAEGKAAAGPSFGEGMIEMTDVARDTSGKPRSPFEVTFPSAILWGLVGCATTFAASLVRERTAGTLLRLHVAPIRRAHLLLGKGLACFLAGLGVTVVLLAFGVAALGVRIVAPGMLAAGVVMTAVAFSGLMMLLSVIGRTEAAVAGGSWVFIMPLAMIGGGMIPLISMPKWMLTASYVSPFRWGILAIEGGVWRDFSVTEAALPWVVLAVIAAGAFAAGATIFSRRG